MEKLKEFEKWFLKTYYGNDNLNNKLFYQIVEKIDELLNRTPSKPREELCFICSKGKVGLCKKHKKRQQKILKELKEEFDS